jgi:hypothetical protein
MARLRPGKLHVTFGDQTTALGPVTPRRYTLTHSDLTGDLFLTIGREYDHKQISGWYTKLMRDEVLAEWLEEDRGPRLDVYCHVSGGLALGPSRFRFEIFQRELPLVLEAIRHGDRSLFDDQPHLDRAPIMVHLHAREARYNRVEEWGTPADYDVSTYSTAGPPREAVE